MKNNPLDLAGFLRLVIEALEAAGVDYLIGGAIAEWAWGELRATQALGEFDKFFDHNSKKSFYFSAISAAGNKVLARSINPPSWATNNHKKDFFLWYEMPDTSKSMSCLAPCAAASITWNISSAVSRVRFRSRIGRPTFPP